MPEDQRGFLRATGFDRLPSGGDCYWEDDAAVSPDAVQYIHSTPRHDLPLSRRRWQFAPRDEHYGRIKGG